MEPQDGSINEANFHMIQLLFQFRRLERCYIAYTRIPDSVMPTDKSSLVVITSQYGVSSCLFTEKLVIKRGRDPNFK